MSASAAQGEVLLYTCAAPGRKLTVKGCGQNRGKYEAASREHDGITVEMYQHCEGCPGVVGLAEQGGPQPEMVVIERGKPERKRAERQFRDLRNPKSVDPELRERRRQPPQFSHEAEDVELESSQVIAESESVQPARAAPAASCPPGWVTVPDLARETGIARNTVAEALAARGFTVELYGGCLCCSREDADAWLAERATRARGLSLAEMARRAGVAPPSIRKALRAASLLETTELVAGERVLPADVAEKFLAEYAGARPYHKSRGEERWGAPAGPTPKLEAGRPPGLVTFKELADEEGVIPETIHARVAGARREGLLKPVNPGETPMLWRRTEIEAVMAKHRPVPRQPKNIDVEVPVAAPATTSKQAERVVRTMLDTPPKPRAAAPPAPPPVPKSGVKAAVSGDLRAIFDLLTSQRRTRLLEREALDVHIREIDQALLGLRYACRIASVELPADEASA